MQIRLIYDFYVFSDLLNTFVFPYHCLDFLLIRYASSLPILHNSSVDVCLSVFGFQGTGCRSLCSDHFLWKRSSGDGEIRTHDPLLARQVLSQLSYTPTGATHRLTVVTIWKAFPILRNEVG